jgi:hypothetical protein
MTDRLSCGMTPAEAALEADEAERETVEFEATRQERYKTYLATLTKHERHNLKRRAQKCCDSAFSRADKLNAVPRWLTKEDEAAILKLYHLSVELESVTGVPHSVDHIIPLRGICRKTWRGIGKRVHAVCGLHVPDNLRVIPLGINRNIKGDWFDTDWPACPNEVM